MIYDLIAIDPGNKEQDGVCACALFSRTKLVALLRLNYRSARDIALLTNRAHKHDVALEVPMIYPQGHDRPNDLIQLGIAGALVAAAFAPYNIFVYTPAQWKGQKAKPACHLIMWEKLAPAERSLFKADTEQRIRKGVAINAPRMYKQPLKNYAFDAHNDLDATGIGRFHMGLI